SGQSCRIPRHPAAGGRAPHRGGREAAPLHDELDQAAPDVRSVVRLPGVPIAAEGWPFILVPLALGGVGLGAGSAILAGPGLVAAAFMAYFFRDPDRTVPPTPGAFVAPADGRVVRIVPRVEDPFVGVAQQVSIFLSPLDVHVNRAPASGLVVEVDHRPG